MCERSSLDHFDQADVTAVTLATSVRAIGVAVRPWRARVPFRRYTHNGNYGLQKARSRIRARKHTTSEYHNGCTYTGAQYNMTCAQKQ